MKDRFTDMELARCIHELHRAMNVNLDDPAPAPPFDTLTPEPRETLLRMVRMIRNGATPEMIQDQWVASMRGRGWKHGAVKDPTASPPTHPSMVKHSFLSKMDQEKINLAFEIVSRLG